MATVKKVIGKVRCLYRTAQFVCNFAKGAESAYRRVDGMIRIKQPPRDVAEDEKRLARKVVINALFSFCCAVALIRATPYVLAKL